MWPEDDGHGHTTHTKDLSSACGFQPSLCYAEAPILCQATMCQLLGTSSNPHSIPFMSFCQILLMSFVTLPVMLHQTYSSLIPCRCCRQDEEEPSK